MIKKEMTTTDAQAKLEELCARAERCEWELIEKLRRWGISSADMANIMAHLRKYRFVDDSRFAEAYVNDKIKFARWGKRKVYQGLLQKRIASDIVKQALCSVDPDLYTDNLRDFFLSKIKAHPELKESFEGRTKLFRYAISRGYEPALASSTLKSILR